MCFCWIFNISFSVNLWYFSINTINIWTRGLYHSVLSPTMENTAFILFHPREQTYWTLTFIRLSLQPLWKFWKSLCSKKTILWYYQKSSHSKLQSSGHRVLLVLILAVLSGTALHLGCQVNAINYHRLENQQYRVSCRPELKAIIAIKWTDSPWNSSWCHNN